jgi:hypothetical protein
LAWLSQYRFSSIATSSALPKLLPPPAENSARTLAARGDHPGLVQHVISAMEACPTYKPWHSKETHRTFLRPATGK